MKNQILKTGTKLVIDFPKDLPTIEVQYHEIEQIFINILNNSIYALKQKFSGEDPENFLIITGGTVKKNDKKYIRTTFYDGGIGIPQNILDKICNPFFSSKPNGKGTGLGLSISYNIVQSHGGELTFESLKNCYTKVFVDLPVK